ncbi:MAG: flagellar filament capping protein FliD [Deferrisomatales bacterium]|nr:flagellar filament capping protein FliD [Deferrisomatales bacterium]
MPGTISFDGLATGIDTTSLVDQLVTVESRPKILKEAEKVRLENQLSSWQEINTRLLTVSVAANDLSRLATWNSQNVTSSDDSLLTATAALGAPQGTYTLQVDNLARAHQIATPTNPGGGDTGYTANDSLFGTGVLVITVGSTAHTLTLDADSGTLDGVAKAVNDAKIGVTASVIYNGSGYQLLFSADETGVENALSVDASGVAGGEKALPATPEDWATVQAALDASISLGSGAGKITVTSATNTVDTLLQGVTIDLHGAAPGTDVTLTVARNAENLTEKVQTFVDAYNEASVYISEQFAYDPDKDVAGILMGDSALLGVQRSLSGLLQHAVDRGSDYKTLGSVGLKTTETGTLEFDAAVFSGAVQDDFDGVMRLFRNGGDSDHAKVSFVYANDDTRAGAYAVNVTAAATRGSAVGTAAAPTSLTVSTGVNDEITLAVDGAAPVTVTLAAGTYASAQELATELQTRINEAIRGSVTVGFDAGGALQLTSNRYGSASRVALTGGNALAALNLAAATATTGTDVAGTINGEAATGTGQILKGNAGNANTDGLQILVQLDAPGTATLTVTKGVFSRFDEYLTDLTDPFTGAAGLREETLNTSIGNLRARIEEMEGRLDLRRERLLLQFQKMESAVSAFNSQGSFITNALGGLSNNWAWNNK